MLISAVIPTRSRPDDLGRAVASVCAQSRRPDQLIIVDQSADDASRSRVAALLATSPPLAVDYIHDPTIAGLVAAKKHAVAHANGDIVCFLEDDVVLEPDYLRNIEAGFIGKPSMIGSCGVVTDLPPLPPFYCALFHFFHRGIFRDPRVGVHGMTKGHGHDLIPSDYISGGLSAYRREVFDSVPFDVANGFFALEDIDFSTRVARRFGPNLYINPNARLEHRMSPANRAVLGARQERKVREFVLFYKKRRGEGARPGHFLLLAGGLFLEGAFQSVQGRSIEPLLGYFRGLRQGALQRIVKA